MRTVQYTNNESSSDALAALITNEAALKLFSERYPVTKTVKGATIPNFQRPFTTDALNIIAQWCVTFYSEHGTAPNKAIKTIFEQWAHDKSEPQIDAIESLLTAVSERHEWSEECPDSYRIEQLDGFLKKQYYKKRSEDLSTALESSNGELAKLEKNPEHFQPYRSLQATEDVKFATTGLQDLLTGEIEMETYLVDRILVKGQPCIMAGPEKSLKTSMALDLAISLSSGEPFLGHFDVDEKQNVLIMSGESGAATIKKNLRIINEARNTKGGRKKSLQQYARIDFCPTVPLFTSPSDMAALKTKLIECESKVLIIDTASLAMNGENAGNLFVMQSQLRAVGDICQTLGVTLLLLHHSKGLGVHANRPLKLTDIVFAGFKEYFRQWLLLSRREDYVPPDQGEDRVHRLWLVAGGSVGHSGCYSIDANEGSQSKPQWVVSISSVKEGTYKDASRKTQDQSATDQERVLRVLADHPKGLVYRELFARSSLKNTERAKIALATLLDSGKIRKTNTSNRGHKGFAYLLTELVNA
jgi:hypothetical protein